MKRRRYHFTQREQLDAFQRRLQEKWLRRDVPGGHIEIRQPVLRQTDEHNTFEVGWTLHLSSKWGGYGQWHDIPEEVLEELHAMIGQMLELKPPAQELKVVLEQARPRRRKKIPSPAQALEDASEVALTPEERAIHRRMLEGR